MVAWTTILKYSFATLALFGAANAQATRLHSSDIPKQISAPLLYTAISHNEKKHGAEDSIPGSPAVSTGNPGIRNTDTCNINMQSEQGENHTCFTEATYSIASTGNRFIRSNNTNMPQHAPDIDTSSSRSIGNAGTREPDSATTFLTHPAMSSPAIWTFGAGLIGLVTVARRTKH